MDRNSQGHIERYWFVSLLPGDYDSDVQLLSLIDLYKGL